jgi:HK97 family phage major capsid protein
MTLNEMMQERAKVYDQLKVLQDKYNDKPMESADNDTYGGLEKRFDELTASIEKENKKLSRDRAMGEQAPEQNKSEKHAEMVTAFKDAIRRGDRNSLEIYNALQQDNPTQAGYLVPPEEFVSELIKELADATFMRQKAKVLPPLRGAQSLGYPTKTAGMSSFTWGMELQTPTADTSLAFGKREFKPRPGTSEILISNTLIRNVPNVDALVRGEIAEEVSAALETAYMTGSGANCPLGLFVASADGINTDRDVSTGNTATEIKFDGLMEAKYSVKGKYQTNAEWIFHRDAIKQIAKLKNADGQYVWQPSVVLGTPDMLLGRPVNSSEYAPNTFTTGLYVGLYGDLRNYWIVDSLLMEIKVLTELYARSNQVDYLSRIETDGAPVLSAAFARVKLA